jgi:hypothetical protein
MKYSTLLTLLLMFAFGCGNKHVVDLEEIKENPDARERLFAGIINDSELLKEFIDQMMYSEAGMHQLMTDDNIMKHIFEVQNMYLVAQTKPEIMLMMVNNLAHITKNDTSLRLMMMNLPPMQQLIREQGREFARQ